MFIFAHGDKANLQTNVRIIAGFTLKSCLKFLFNDVTAEEKAYIRNCILTTLIDPNQQIRNAAGVLIAQLITVSSLESWPELMPALMEMLKSNNQDYIITSLSCLSKMMEDNVYELDTPAVNYPLNTLIPMFLQFFQCPNEEIVYHSVNCMRFTIDAMPNALLVNMDNYLHVAALSASHAGSFLADDARERRDARHHLQQSGFASERASGRAAGLSGRPLHRHAAALAARQRLRGDAGDRSPSPVDVTRRVLERLRDAGRGGCGDEPTDSLPAAAAAAAGPRRSPRPLRRRTCDTPPMSSSA